MKAKALFFFLIVNLTITSVFSQDVLYKKDGTREEAKIILMGNQEIQYKKFDNPEGPVYTINKTDLVMVSFENGSYEIISKTETGEKPDLHNDFASNVFTYHLFDLVFMDFTISYEKIIGDGKIGIRVPVSFGYDFDEWNFNHVFYSGLGLNFYPTGQGKWRYFMGPQIQLGIGKEDEWIDYYDNQYNYLYSDEVENEGFFMRFLVDNGVMFLPVRNFGISAVGSIGIRYFPEAPYEDDVMRTVGHFAINLSYRF